MEVSTLRSRMAARRNVPPSNAAGACPASSFRPPICLVSPLKLLVAFLLAALSLTASGEAVTAYSRVVGDAPNADFPKVTVPAASGANDGLVIADAFLFTAKE